MKKQIEKLIEIADGYAVFGTEVGLPMTHNTVRGEDDKEWVQKGKKISIYLAESGSTWAVYFNGVNIIGYSKKVELPYNVTAQYLNKVIADVGPYLYDYLFPNVAKCKIGVLKEKHKEIKRLESELRKLKGLVTSH